MSWIVSKIIDWFNFATVPYFIWKHFSTVLSSTEADIEVWISLVTQMNSRIQVVKFQEYVPELDDEWLADD